jgi:hypothetical protein
MEHSDTLRRQFPFLFTLLLAQFLRFVRRASCFVLDAYVADPCNLLSNATVNIANVFG